MEERKDKQIVQRVFETSLSGLREDPYLAQRVLNIAHGKEEKIVNRTGKKPSKLVVVALALVLVSATAAFASIDLFQQLIDVWHRSFQSMNTTGDIDIEDRFAFENTEDDYAEVKSDLIISTVPLEGDLDYVRAYTIARQAIIDKFGTPVEELDAIGVYPTFYNSPYQNEINEWEFYFTPLRNSSIDEDHDYIMSGEYRVRIASPSGKVTLCNWYIDDFFPDYARRTWAAGKQDYVFSRAKSLQFFEQNAEDQAYFISLFEEAGYDSSEIMLSNELVISNLAVKLAFAESESNILHTDSPEVRVAIAAMEDASGLTKEQLERYCFILTPSPISSDTIDLCFSFNYNIQEERMLASPNQYEHVALNHMSRLGFYMISLDPDTHEVVKVLHGNRTYKVEETDDNSPLLGRSQWDKNDMPEFTEFWEEACKLDELVNAGKITMNEATEQMDSLMRFYGYTPSGTKSK